MFENWVLRRIFRSKRDEVTGEGRKFYNKYLNDLYSSLSIIQVIKSRRMRLAGYEHIWGRGELSTGFWWVT